MLCTLWSRVTSILKISVVLAVAVGAAAAIVITDRAELPSLYHGPAACPLVGTEDLLRLGNPPGSQMLLDQGFESDLKRSWTETRSTRRRVKTKIDRSQKVGQQCSWVWQNPADESTARERTSLSVFVLNRSSVRSSLSAAPLLAGSVALIEGLATADRPSAGWRWTDLPTPGRPTLLNCTVRQIVGLRLMEITWSSIDADASCAGTVTLAINAGDSLADADRVGTTPS
jgi:hypothetical protein